MTTRQEFKTVDVLRLEVQTTPTGRVNYVKNPDGDLGGWFYLTPEPYQAVAGYVREGQQVLNFYVVDGPDDPAQNGSVLTEPVPVTAGRSVGARLDYVARDYASDKLQLQLRFTDDAGTIVGSSAFTDGHDLGAFFAPVTEAPAGSRYVQLVIRRTNAVTGFYDGHNVFFTDVMLTHDDTQIPAVFDYVPPIVWTDILGPSHEVRVERNELDPGTLTATIYDASLNPVYDDVLRPGKAVRLVLDGFEDPIFTGTISVAAATYDLRQTKGDRRAKITLTAVDGLTKLANILRANGVATVPELATALEGCGIAWSLNGDSNQRYFTTTVVSTNANASMLDQIVLTRDTVRGSAFINRLGQITVRSSPAPYPLATFDPTAYSDAAIDYSSDTCINVVSVKLLRTNLATGETAEVPYGPFRDQASIDAWGPYSAEFTVHGLPDNETAMAAYAQAVLDANGTPEVRINSIRLPIATTGHLSRAVLDLYDRVEVQGGLDTPDDRFAAYPRVYTDTYPEAFAQDSLVTGITHSITPDKWLMDVRLSSTGTVAIPLVTPSPPTTGA